MRVFGDVPVSRSDRGKDADSLDCNVDNGAIARHAYCSCHEWRVGQLRIIDALVILGEPAICDVLPGQAKVERLQCSVVGRCVDDARIGEVCFRV
jgi:hypothetical protein